MWQETYKDCLAYIDQYWDKITRRPEKRKIHRFTLEIPHPYVVPNDKKFNFIFYRYTQLLDELELGKHI